MAEHDDQPITPYAGVHDLLKATRDIKAQTPGGIFMCTGLTWLEQFGANVGAGGIEQGWFDIAGFGRQAFAIRILRKIFCAVRGCSGINAA